MLLTYHYSVKYIYAIKAGKRKKMQLTVSGVKKEYEDGITLPKLFEIENVETPEYVTVSINEEFIPGDQKETYQLKDGDNVEFLYFMGGGQR